MSTKPMKPIKQPAPNTNVSMADTEPFVCEDCGNAVFIPAVFLRRLSPLMSPTGKEAMIPIQVYSCGNCGKVPTTLMKEFNGKG
jgi:predicted RNA-binding Zn-ribbon protein involved in translation (DUF1610 family)|tara:strand:- start:1705 stop:1956 length:252 start_codon:yes stop_codon:yes gene_type:complete